MTTFAQWALERFCGQTARMAHSRVYANVNIAINSQLGQQENALRYTLPNLEIIVKDDDDYTELELEKGEDIADLLNAMIGKLRGVTMNEVEDLVVAPITLTLPPFNELSDGETITTCTLAEKHNYRKMSAKERLEAAERMLAAEGVSAVRAIWLKMAEIEISEKETIDGLHTLPIHIRRELTRWIGRSSRYTLGEESLESVCKYKVCKLITAPLEKGGRKWMVPDIKIRITGKELRRGTITRSSSLVSYRYNVFERRARTLTGTALGEVEFFVSIDLLGGELETSTHTVLLAYVRALPTTTLSITGTTDCKLVRLTNPGAFDGGDGRRHFIECNQIVDLAGLIRDRMDLYVIGSRSCLGLIYTE